MKLVLTDRATNDLSKINKIFRDHIIKSFEKERIEFIKLTGRKDMYRARVGDYRVVALKEKDVYTITKIAHRKDVYKSLYTLVFSFMLNAKL